MEMNIHSLDDSNRFTMDIRLQTAVFLAPMRHCQENPVFNGITTVYMSEPSKQCTFIPSYSYNHVNNIMEFVRNSLSAYLRFHQKVKTCSFYRSFVVSRAFMAGAASQAGDADSSRAPGLTSGLQGSVNVHRVALLLVTQ